MTIGPDAFRYLTLAQGRPVPRPFHLRRLLPWICGVNERAWWSVWALSWPLAAAGMFGWRIQHDRWEVALATAVLLLALPGILGPPAVIPVGVDLPATALGLVGIALVSLGHPAQIIAGVIVVAVAAGVRETIPLWAALWLWSPWPLLALLVPIVIALARKPGPDPLGEKFQAIADHPIRAALELHRGRWRDAWLMVAPWGVTLAAFYSPDWRLLLVVALAYLQLLIATDTVRLIHHAAGPVTAVAAAQTIPVEWLLLACVVHVVWWRTPERI
jgi:hypothetical protein